MRLTNFKDFGLGVSLQKEFLLFSKPLLYFIKYDLYIIKISAQLMHKSDVLDALMAFMLLWSSSKLVDSVSL